MTIPSSGATLDPTAEAVLRFWFGEGPGEVRPFWFKSTAELDGEIAARFGGTIEAALAGRRDGWAATPEGALALIVVLDQFTRNAFRGTARAFAGDCAALVLAGRLVGDGGHLGLPPLRRWFAYLPFEHAEDAAAQRRSVALFADLAAGHAGGPLGQALAGALDYAERHRVVIDRFGRFPHRNTILGRPSTAEEIAYLAEPGAGF